MTTSALASATGLATWGGATLPVACAVAGLAFVVEAAASVFIDAHVGYHSLNAVLNLALLVAAVSLARSGKALTSRAVALGGWATALMALLAVGGGVWAVLVEAFTSTESPGIVEGVSHTAVLASMLFMVPLGLGLRRADPPSGLVIAASSACLVTMVLAGLDQPEQFLVPEATLGLGWMLLGRALHVDGRRR